MALTWSPWIVLDPEQVEQLGPRSTGLYEVKVDRRLVDYPTGKSAMIFYGCTDDQVQTVRDALERDWLVEEKVEVLSQWAEYGQLVWRFALQEEPKPEHDRRMESFVLRFGRTPWANPDAES